MTYSISLRTIAAFVAGLALISMALLPTTPASADHNADDMQGFWTFSEGSGTDAADSSGHGNDGTVSGATWSGGAPLIGDVGGLSFDGVDDLVSVPDAAELDLSDELTIAFWFMLDGESADNDYPRAVSKGQTTNTDGAYGVFIQDSPATTRIGLRFIDESNATRNVDATGIADYGFGWHHVVATYSNSGNVGKIYVDGVQVKSQAIGGDVAVRNTADDLTIGAGIGDENRHFNGSVDEVRIYDRAIGVDEVEALYNYGLFTISLSPETAINPTGSEHTVVATIEPPMAGIPVLFHTEGANIETNYPEYTFTDSNGQAEFTYAGAAEGEDLIWGCIDLSYFITGGGACNVPDYVGEPYATAAKSWIAPYYVTGGGTVKDGKKPAYTFGGNVGQLTDGGTLGELQINKHTKPDTDSCHYDEFTNLVFSGVPAQSPSVGLNTIEFDASGECKNGGPSNIHVIMVDNAEPGGGIDELTVTGDLTINGPISTGNIQMHGPAPATPEPVGADSASYVAPVSCDITVDDDGGEDYETIQDAVDNAVGGETVCVADGLYNEFVVDKPLTIAGLSNPINGSAEVTPSSGAVTDVILVESSDVTITGLLVDGNGTDLAGNQGAAIRISPVSGDIDNVHITYNVIQNLAAVSGTASNKGIQWFTEAASGYSLTNSSFANNVIDGITSVSKGAYGIQTVGDMDDVSITNNTISNVTGAWGAGVALDSKDEVGTTGVVVSHNQLVDSLWSDVSVQVEHNVDQTGIVVNQNNLEFMVHGSGVPATGPEVNAENNWWGDLDPSDDVFGPIDYTPLAPASFPLN